MYSEDSQAQTNEYFTPSAYILSYLGVELVDGEPDAEDDHCDEGHGHAAIPDLDGEVGQLGLQHTLLLVIATAAGAALARALRGVAGGVGKRVVGMGVTHSLLHIH